jgi:hypothetical protein
VLEQKCNYVLARFLPMPTQASRGVHRMMESTTSSGILLVEIVVDGIEESF